MKAIKWDEETLGENTFSHSFPSPSSLQTFIREKVE
jgi:hypothetical protein